jgi:hypothetical protein
MVARAPASNSAWRVRCVRERSDESKSRGRYTAYVARTAESLGWAWAYCQFDSDFVAYDIDTDHWIKPIRKALIP